MISQNQEEEKKFIRISSTWDWFMRSVKKVRQI